MFIEKFLIKTEDITREDVETLCENEVEHLCLELKERIDDNVNNLLKPFSAFANAKGGLLILGVSISGQVIGLDQRFDEQRITNIIRDAIEPSMAGHFNIVKTVDANCYLVDIMPVPFIVGIRVRNNANNSYMYFIRNSHESRQLSPSELQQVITEKADYAYNEEYRYAVLSLISNAEDTFDLIGNREGKTKYEIGQFVELYNSSSGIPNSEFKVLEKYVLECKCKNLSVNIIHEIVNAYARIIELQTTGNRIANLTKNEDDALSKLQDEMHQRFGIPKRPNVDQIYSYSYAPDKYHYNLSLKDYVYEYVRIILEDYVNGNPDILLDEYETLRSESVNGMLRQYDTEISDVKDRLHVLCIKHEIPKDIIDHLLETIDKFPEEFLVDYLAIMGQFKYLKKATKNALYLET